MFYLAFRNKVVNVDVICKTFISRAVWEIAPIPMLPCENDAVVFAGESPTGNLFEFRLEFPCTRPSFRNQSFHSGIQSHTRGFLAYEVEFFHNLLNFDQHIPAL